ncbi:MAG: lysylphosphatidylglycerol synthase domain-containing protein [Flavisolibacter sp.]
MGPLLFAWLAFSIYQQISKQEHLESSWLQIRSSFSSYKIIYLIIAVLLIPVNWGLEALKWKISVNSIHPIRFLHAFKAVLSGVSFSVTLPNRVGEYAGRILYMPEGNRLKTISVTVVGSIAQLLITLIAGIIGLILLKSKLVNRFEGFRIWYQFALYGLVIAGIATSILYFNVAVVVKLFKRWIREERFIYLVDALRLFDGSLLLQLLLLSSIRYMIFITQYILLFYLFEVNVDAATLMTVMSVVFLAMAMIPSIALVEVGLRNEISIQLVGMFSTNLLGISFTSVTIWFMNLVLPAIIGSILILNLRVFNKKNGVH